jgi:hypothetical protein
MERLKQINKTKFLIPYEQLYIQSHHHHKQLYIQSHHNHKQLIPEQNSGEYNPMYQLVYHAAPYKATGPSPTPASPLNHSAHNLQPANS